MAIIPLKILDVQKHMDLVTNLEAQADAFGKLGAPAIPGVPDIKSMVKALIDAEKEKLIDKGRQEFTNLLVLVMSLGIAELLEMEPEINKGIAVLNKIITLMGAAIKILAAVAAATFVIIIALTIIFVVTKIIGLIPSLVVAFGSGVSFDMPKFIAGETMQVAAFLLTELWPIASKCISVIYMLLKLYAIFSLIMGLMKMFMMTQNNSSSTAENAFNRTADDWSNVAGGDDVDKSKKGPGEELVECTLPNGEVKQMSAKDCIAAGGTFPGMNKIGELNNLNKKINDLSNMTPIDPNLCWDGCQHGIDLDGSKQITCQIPDGSSEDISLTECNERNGIDLSVANLMGLLSELRNKRDQVCKDLGALCDFQLGDNTITSLLYGNDDATIEDATKDTGKRKGFYGSDI